MSAAYDPEQWHDLFVAVGIELLAISAALVGVMLRLPITRWLNAWVLLVEILR